MLADEAGARAGGRRSCRRSERALRCVHQGLRDTRIRSRQARHSQIVRLDRNNRTRAHFQLGQQDMIDKRSSQDRLFANSLNGVMKFIVCADSM